MSRAPTECDEWGVLQEVRLTSPELVDELVAVLRDAGTPARKRGRVVVVGDEPDGESERSLELLFFLRTWALAHPDLDFEIRERD
jgi:hypothetical protein